jgi:hypothetical protein
VIVRADLNLTHPADLNLTRGWVLAFWLPAVDNAQQPLWPKIIAKGIVVQAKRWVVERTHAGNERSRRLVAHHDRSTWAPLAWVWLAEARILSTKLAT